MRKRNKKHERRYTPHTLPRRRTVTASAWFGVCRGRVAIPVGLRGPFRVATATTRAQGCAPARPCGAGACAARPSKVRVVAANRASGVRVRGVVERVTASAATALHWRGHSHGLCVRAAARTLGRRPAAVRRVHVRFCVHRRRLAHRALHSVHRRGTVVLCCFTERPGQNNILHQKKVCIKFRACSRFSGGVGFYIRTSEHLTH